MMIKRLLAILLCACCLFALGIPVASVMEEDAPQNAEAAYPALKDYSVTYSCNYRPQQNAISISGNVNHEIMVSYKNYTIEIHALALGESVEEWFSQPDRQPLASTDLAVKFEFYIKVEKLVERFFSYVIVLRSPDGKTAVLAAPPQIPSVEAKAVSADEMTSAFKGVRGTHSSIGGSFEFGTAIVPVYLNRLFCDTSSGYMYLVEGTYCYFDQDYVHELDQQIRMYSASGGRVYLQLLLPIGTDDALSSEAGEGILYDCPNVYSEETVKRLSTYASFLTSRYSSYQNGKISGFVLGSAMDQPTHSYCGALTMEDYAELYTVYAAIIGNTARIYQATLDIVIPFSDFNTYGSGFYEGDGYAPHLLLEKIVSCIDSRFSSAFPFSTMIESSSMPLIWNEKTHVFEPNVTDERLSIASVALYSDYLSALRSRYENAPTHYTYLWNAPEELALNSLACAYAYSYYSLLTDNNLLSFVLCAGKTPAADFRLLEIRQILQYIDTERSYDVTGNLLSLFGKTSWNDVLTIPLDGKMAIRSVYRLEPTEMPSSIRGSFSYVDFSSKELTGWCSGSNVKDIKLSYGNEGERVLRTDMLLTNDETYSELFCLYEYEENWSHTPYIQFTVEVLDSAKTQNTLYELVITVGDDQASLLSGIVVYGNQKTEIVLDVSPYISNHTVQYMKIGLRPIAESSQDTSSDVSLLMNDIRGFSAVYSSEELTELIEADRSNIRNHTKTDDENTEQRSLTWIVFGVLVAITGVVAGAFMIFKRYDDEEVDGNSETSLK